MNEVLRQDSTVKINQKLLKWRNECLKFRCAEQILFQYGDNAKLCKKWSKKIYFSGRRIKNSEDLCVLWIFRDR